MGKICKGLLRLFGWNSIGEPPQLTHCILIVAPHTSNWDFILAILFKISHNLKLRYFGKDSLFKWYNAWFFKFFGGMPVDRSRPNNAVNDKVKSLKSSPRFWLGMAPEGTRSYSKYWRSGFYHIAYRADVPIVMVFIDAKTKSIGFGPTLKLTGNIKQDMDEIREFYSDKVGIKHQLSAPIQLKNELE